LIWSICPGRRRTNYRGEMMSAAPRLSRSSSPLVPSGTSRPCSLGDLRTTC
jgi:hypothetical protein